MWMGWLAGGHNSCRVWQEWFPFQLLGLYLCQGTDEMRGRGEQNQRLGAAPYCLFKHGSSKFLVHAEQSGRIHRTSIDLAPHVVETHRLTQFEYRFTYSKSLPNEIISWYFEGLTQKQSVASAQNLLAASTVQLWTCQISMRHVHHSCLHFYGPTSHSSVVLDILSCYWKRSCEARGDHVEVCVIGGGWPHTPLSFLSFLGCP